MSSTGKLIYLIGASGSGKDTLLKSFRQSPAMYTQNTLVAHRYVARKTNADKTLFENQISLTFDEFEARSEKNLFAMQWHAHKSSYGIGSEIDLWMQSGVNVVVNGSREYVPEMLEKYPNAVIVALIVSDEALMQRLSWRGRESEKEIKERIERNQRLSNSLPEGCIKVDTSGERSQTLEQFQALLKEL